MSFFDIFDQFYLKFFVTAQDKNMVENESYWKYLEVICPAVTAH